MSNLVEITVVVGKVTLSDDSKEAPQVIALAVALSVISILKVSPSTGVPDKLVVMEVIAAACAVIVTTSQLSVLIVGVAWEVIVVTLLVILLLVNVWV